MPTTYKNTMGGILSKIDTCTQDYFDYGLRARCPNCDSRTLLSYPTTVCTKCQTHFQNDITAVKIDTHPCRYGGQWSITQYGRRVFDSNIPSINLREEKQLTLPGHPTEFGQRAACLQQFGPSNKEH